MALRGHASIQGSTDIPTLYNILPGYLTMPHTEHYGGLEGYIEREDGARRLVGKRTPTSSRCSRRGGARPRRRRTTSASTTCRASTTTTRDYWTVAADARREGQGVHRRRREPRGRSANGSAQRLGLAKLDWLVVRDLVEIETAAFWYDSPEIESGELARSRSRPRCSSCRPARTSRRTARSRTPSGCCSGTTRRSSRRRTAAPSSGSTTTSARRSRSGSRSRRSRGTGRSSDLTWDYPEQGEIEEPSASAVLAEINGVRREGPAPRGLQAAEGGRLDELRLLDLLRRLRRRRQQGGAPQAALGAGVHGARVGAGRGRRTAGCSTTAPRRIPTASRGRSGRSSSGGTSEQGSGRARTRPTSTRRSRPTTCRPTGARARRDRRRPPVHHAGRRARLALRPAGARGRAAADALRAARVAVRQPALPQRANPRRQQNKELAEDPYNPVATSRRRAVPVRRHDLPAHRAPHRRRHVALRAVPRRSSSRRCSCEVHPELARERGLEHGGWATIVTAAPRSRRA